LFPHAIQKPFFSGGKHYKNEPVGSQRISDGKSKSSTLFLGFFGRKPTVALNSSMAAVDLWWFLGSSKFVAAQYFAVHGKYWYRGKVHEKYWHRKAAV
jgi:hypothetical protein